MPDRSLTLYYAPHSRSLVTRFLLAELGADYQLQVLNLAKGDNRQPAYLAVNPMGKVPALLVGDSLVTEQVAIFIYAADLLPQAGLAPAIDDPLRGPYLRWLAFYGSCYEPALTDRSLKREPAPLARSPYGTFDMVVDTLRAQLQKGPYLLGERLSAADLLWGVSLNWSTLWGLLPEDPVFRPYIDRIVSRPAFVQVQKEEEQFLAGFASQS